MLNVRNTKVEDLDTVAQMLALDRDKNPERGRIARV
jgi:hypothetical protein